MSVGSDDRLYKALLNQFMGPVLLFDENLALLSWNNHLDQIYPVSHGVTKNQHLKDVLQLPSAESLEDLKARWDKDKITTAFCSLYALPKDSYGITTFRPLMLEGGLTGLLVQINPELGMPKPHELNNPLFNNVLDHVQEAVLITHAQIDGNGPQVFYVNQAFLNVTGYSVEEIYGESPRIFDGINSDTELPDVLKHNLRRYGNFHGKVVNYSKSSYPYTIDWEIVPLKGMDGEIRYYLAVQRDITELKSTERKLKESEEKFRAVTQQSQVGLFIFQDDALVYVNPKTAEITGYTEKELTQVDPFSLIIPEQREEIKDKVNHQLDHQLTNLQYQFQITTKEGEKRDIEVLSSLFDHQNQPAILASALDVTERNQAFEKLRFSQHFNEKVAETAPIFIAITDYKSMQYIYENGRFQEVIGYTMDEVNAMPEGILSLIHPDDRPHAVTSIQQNMNLSDGETNEIKFRVKAKTGEYRWFSAIDTPFRRDEYGYPVQFLSNAQDITEQQNNIESIREQQRFIEDVTQNTPSFVNIYDYEKERFIYENHSILAYLGYDPDRKESRYNLFHPDDRESIRQFNKENLQLKEGEVNTIEYRMQHRDGHYRWFYNRDVVHKRNKDGRVKQVLGLIADVTEEKHIQQSLRRSEAYYRQLVENAPIGIVTLDLNYRVITCNDAFEELFGYQEKELQELFLDQIIVPDERKNEAVAVTKNSLEGKTEWRETVRLTKAGKEVPVIVYGVPVFFEGEPVSIYGIYVDITERKQAEDALSRQTEALLYSNAELEQFAYITSHHLRSPVINLQSLTALFDKTELRDRENQYIFHKIQESAEELNNTLADITHILQKKDNLSEPKETVDFEEVFGECLRLLQEVIKDTEAEVTTHFSKAPRIQLIRSFLSSICYHLLSNALGFRHPDRKPAIHFETEQQGDYICIMAFDNGLGINLDRNQHRIFELYKGVHEGRSGKGRGLYLVKYQVEAMGGYIQVESQENVGSWFYIYLPVFSTGAA